MTGDATSPSSLAEALGRAWRRATARSISTARSAAAATARAILDAARCRVVAHRPRSRGRRARRRAGASLCRPPHPDRRPLRRDGAAAARRSASRAVAGVALDLGVSSAQLDDAGARLLLPRRRAARHAHGRRRADAPPISSTRLPRRALADLISRLWRGALRPPRRARHRAARARRRSPAPRELAAVVRRRRAGEPAASIPRPAPSRRCASR